MRDNLTIKNRNFTQNKGRGGDPSSPLSHGGHLFLRTAAAAAAATTVVGVGGGGGVAICVVVIVMTNR